MVDDEKGRSGDPAPKLIFACSGAADVGRVADMAARTMTRDGIGSMFCLAGVGGRVEGILERTASAARILAIDGCSLECAGQCLQQAGFGDFAHLRLDRLGMEKGQTPPAGETIQRVVQAGSELLA
jgi:uncharacterized metal-binding protein